MAVNSSGSAFPEVIFSSESSGQLWNTCVWDLKSGTALHTFKGGVSAPNSLALLKTDYLISAEKDKPLIHYWPICKKESSQSRIVCPGRVTAMDVTSDGHYCIAAIDEKIHVWQICTGNLLAIINQHYLTVKHVKVTCDGSHFITGGDDSLVYCWSLASVVSPKDSLKAEPRWTWSNHSMPITDVHVGVTGSSCRIASVSLDHSCRLWDCCTGEEVAVFMLEKPLSAVCMNRGETTLYVGMSTGLIHSISLCDRDQRSDKHITVDSESVYKGHTLSVVCLRLNMDGSMLVSGSHDMTVRVWHSPSHQCIRTLQHKGIISNIIVRPMLSELRKEKFMPSVPIKPFARHSYQPSEDASGDIEVFIPPMGEEESDMEFIDRHFNCEYTPEQINSFLITGDLPEQSEEKVSDFSPSERQLLNDALKANKALYKHALKLGMSAKQKTK